MESSVNQPQPSSTGSWQAELCWPLVRLQEGHSRYGPVRFNPGLRYMRKEPSWQASMRQQRSSKQSQRRRISCQGWAIYSLPLLWYCLLSPPLTYSQFKTGLNYALLCCASMTHRKRQQDYHISAAPFPGLSHKASKSKHYRHTTGRHGVTTTFLRRPIASNDNPVLL